MKIHRDKQDRAHIVALSGGKDSTAMALMLKEREPETGFTYICTPTGNELPDMFAHWRRLSDVLGSPIYPIMAGTLESVIEEEGMIPNFRARFCTRRLKIEPFKGFLLTVIPAVSYVGLRADEADRGGADYGGDVKLSSPDGVTQRYPLQEWNMDLESVWGYLKKNDIQIPERTDCAWCYHQRIGEWWNLWKNHPDIFDNGIQVEDTIGHTFRSPGRDSWPVSMKGLREAFENGRRPKKAGQKDLFDHRETMCRACSM